MAKPYTQTLSGLKGGWACLLSVGAGCRFDKPSGRMTDLTNFPPPAAPPTHSLYYIYFVPWCSKSLIIMSSQPVAAQSCREDGAKKGDSTKKCGVCLTSCNRRDGCPV